MSLLVREATLADCDSIGTIQARTWKTTYKNILTNEFLSTIEDSEIAQAATKRHSSPDIKTFVVTDSSTDLPVGFICMGPSREQNLIADVEVYAIYVLDEHQRSGAGELLLRQALDHLKSQNGRIAFISVFKSNSKARRFYEKMGGQFIGEDCAVIDEVAYQTATYVWDLSKPIYSLSLATNSDILEIRKLVNSAYKELADIGLNYTATYQDENETKNRMSQGRCLVLRDSSRIVATILFYEKNYFTNKRTAYVGQFGVLPELKKSGLGTRLMNYCELLAQNEKYEAIQLDTAIPAKHLVSWYKKRGYNIVGEMHWDSKTYDSYIFEKSLEKSWQQYFEKNKDRPIRPLFLKALDHINKNNNMTAVDVGCGTGTEVHALLQQGFTVHGIDFSPDSNNYIGETLDAKYKKSFSFGLFDFSYYSFYKKYDFVWAYHSLPFCEKSKFENTLGRVLSSVKANGIFAGTIFGEKDEWAISGRCNGLTKSQLQTLLNDFEIIELNETLQDGPTALDGIKRWHIFEVIAKRKEHNFNEKAHRFLDLLTSEMNKQSIFMNPNWIVDHLCYRVSTDAEYNLVKEQFSAIGELLIESEVSGRLISTYKLFEPIKYMNWHIPLVELPAPKKNKATPTGFEHIEIVCDVPFSELESKFKSNAIDLSGLAKSINKEFEVKLEGCSVKFHHLSLESVIRLEKNKKVYKALIESKVLQILEEYNPVVAGTFPLGIFIDNSDLDILLECFDLDRLQKFAKSSFGQLENFKCIQIEVDDVNTLIVNFTFAEVPFELFAQPIPSVNQKAYRHFQVEERLLTMSNDAFAKAVSQLRKQGLKTEPAFAKALSIESDPYKELLMFHSLSNEKLKEKIPSKFHTF